MKKAYLSILLLVAPVLVGATESAQKPGHAAIASAHKLATAAGFEVLGQGGNAFDAAIAVASTLSVVEQQSSGIGGGGLFLLHRAKDGKADSIKADSIKDVMIDARETAPASTDAKQYLDAKGDLDQDKSWNGPLAAGIPGEPAGLVWRNTTASCRSPSRRRRSASRAKVSNPTPACSMRSANASVVIKRYPASAACSSITAWCRKQAGCSESDIAHAGVARGQGQWASPRRIRPAPSMASMPWAVTGRSRILPITRPRSASRGVRLPWLAHRHRATARPVALCEEMLNILSGYDLAKLDPCIACI